MTNYENLAFEVQCALKDMTERQRLHFWSVVRMGYCPDCGREVGSQETCLCRPEDRPEVEIDPEDPFNFKKHGLV